jgi:hypothetical protein
MHPAYFETRFITANSAQDWPKEFAILSAHSTTGEVWSATQNENADQKLQAELASAKVWMRRIIGYSPTTGHREPSWAVEMLLATTAFASSRMRFIMLQETPSGSVTAINYGNWFALVIFANVSL